MLSMQLPPYLFTGVGSCIDNLNSKGSKNFNKCVYVEINNHIEFRNILLNNKSIWEIKTSLSLPEE